MTLKQHPLSAIFPPMPEDEILSLASNIAEVGLKQTILLYQGQVLDGWHRLQACLMVGVNPRTDNFTGKDPKAQVRAANIHRRHLSASQRAFAEVQLSEWAPPGKPAKGAPGAPLETVATMAKNATASERTIQQAKEAELNGSDTLKEAIKDGEISVKAAAKIAKLPKSKQARAMKAPKPKPEGPDWEAQFEELQADYAELKENRDDLAMELKDCESIRSGAHAVEMLKLREEIKHLTRRRDELMAQSHEMRKECGRWQARAKKAGWQP